jgi:hypothetical protein
MNDFYLVSDLNQLIKEMYDVHVFEEVKECECFKVF